MKMQHVISVAEIMSNQRIQKLVAPSVCVCVRSRVKKTFSTDWVSHNSHSNGTDHPLVSAAVMSHVPVRFAQPNCEASAGEPDARLL